MQIKVIGQSDIDGVKKDGNVSGRGTGKLFITVDHHGESLHWVFPPRMWANAVDNNHTVFNQINQYFATLQPAVQQGIFDEYKNIHNVLRSTARNSDQVEDLVDAIIPLAKRLFSYIDPANFDYWVWNVLRPTIPQSASHKVFDPQTMPGTKERTYLYDDYRLLIPMIIVLRMAVPFWFDFVELTHTNLNPEHKEMTTFGLISEAWPARSKAMERLYEFVDHTVGADRNNPAAILLGIGSNTFVYWTLSSLVVTRIPVADIMGYAAPDKSVVNALYSHIKLKVSSLTTSQPSIKNKFTESSFNSDENNQSFLEGFRNRIELTVGQEAYGDYYIEKMIKDLKKTKRNPMSLLERVAPGIDYGLVKDSLKTASKLDISLITDQQINLASWLFHPYSQARASGNFRSGRILSLLGLAQAVLLHLGKTELAILVTGQYTPKNNVETTMVIGETISTLRASEKEAYRKVFPLEKRSKNNRKVDNFVMDDVYNLAVVLQGYDIICTFDDALHQKYRGENSYRNYYLKQNAVSMIMDFVKYLAERPVVRIDPMAVFNKLQANKLGLKPTQSSSF